MNEKLLLKKLGEETLYSAKGHFKACDLRRQLVTYTIWSCAIFNVIGIIGIHPNVDKWLSAIGLFGTIALLMWNEGEGKNYRAKHKDAGEKYLALHKEIRSCFFLTECDSLQIEGLSKKVTVLDQEEKPEIPGYARKWAKRAIEKDGETDNWFLEKEIV
ncbi:MAG: hypothetical protein HOP37_14340 [Cyclobacteriaceae bacterium]|nr:hypothetical protein [Cyclobacteriaceae bacterium]